MQSQDSRAPLQMINETEIHEDLLSAWVIHFSLAGCTKSVLREKLKKPSNIHFWESVAFDESQQFDLIYFLTQTFLSEDIETLGRIILEPEEIHELVQQMASVRKESGEFNEGNYRTEIDRQPFIRCNFNDQKCVSLELLVTDLFDPDHNLRGLLRDLQASINTRNVARGIQVRDSSCVTSYKVTKCTRDKDGTSDTVAPSSQGSKQTRRKGIRNVKPTFAEKNGPMTLSSFKSGIKSTKKNPPQITQKKPRKRLISKTKSDRKSFSLEILKMRRIDTYFKPIPKKIEGKGSHIQDKKANGRSNLNKAEIYTVEDDSDSSIELIGNVFPRDHARVETHDSIIDDFMDSLQEDCITLSNPTITSITTPIQGEALDIDTCVTKENLPHCHATQVAQMPALKAQNVTTDLTLATEDNCTEDISDSENSTNLHHYDKNVFQLDATTKEIIRDWCGGDTFLTQDSPGSSGEVMEQDKTTDKDNDSGVNEHHNWNRNNDKFDNDDDDDDDNNGVMNGGDLYCNGHNRTNDSDSSNESDDDDDDSDDDDDDDSDDDDDDDSDDDGDDDDDDDIESDNVNDKDYVYDSEDESDSESDEDYKKNSNKFKHTLSPRHVQRRRFQRKKS